MRIFSIFKSDKNQIKLPLLGKVTFETDNNYEIKEYKIEPGSFLCSKQFGDFALKFEDPDVDKKCSRFIKDWWNEPIRSYYIYHMADRVTKFI